MLRRCSLSPWLLLASLLILAPWLAGCTQSDQPISAAGGGFEVGDDDDDDDAGGENPQLSPGPAPLRRTEQGEGPSPAADPNQPPSIPGNQLSSFELPDTDDPAELLAFIAQMSRQQPKGETREQMLADLTKMQSLVLQATDKILAQKADEKQRMQAIDAKLGALRTLAQIGVPGTTDKILAFCGELRTEKDPQVAMLGRVIPFSIWLDQINVGEKDDYDAFLAELETLLKLEERDEMVFAVGQQAAIALQNVGQVETASKAYRAVGAAFLTSENPQVAKGAHTLIEQASLVEAKFEQKQNAALMNEPDSMAPFLTTVETLLAPEKKPGRTLFQHVEQAARYMEITQHSEEAGKIYQLAAAAYKGHADEELAKEVSASADNGLKRMALLGKPFDLQVLELDGKPLDWEAYRGKVVLIDFWATWCRPCLREIPNIKQNYDLYREKGFEVIAVNMDEQRQDLEQFLLQQPLPWKTVVSVDPKAPGFDSPLAVKCGVDAIPFIVLVNKDGTVEALHVRGPELGKQLAKLLGPVEGNGPAPNVEPTPPGEQPPAATPQPEKNSWLRPLAETHFVAFLDDNEEDKKGDDAKEKAAEDEDKEDTSNAYLAPAEYGPAELVDFLLNMEEKPRSIQKRPGFTEAVVDAADRLLKADDVKDTYQVIAAESKFKILHERASFGDAKADEALMAFVLEMKEDKRPRIAREVQFLLLERRVIDVDALPLEKVPALLTELQSYFAEQKLTDRHLRIASSTVHAINRLEEDDLREKHFAEFGNLFAKSRDKQLAHYGKKLAKSTAGGESDLVGQPLELVGTTALGTPFNWDTYRGKVVLVDFWATWCGPCRREMPHVKALYEKLKEQGFEVVAVSLDQDLDALAEYLEENNIAWTNLMGEETQALATKYGVRGIPTMMLVDKDGNVVSVSHNVAALAPKAEALLKNPAAKPEGKKKPAIKKPAIKKPAIKKPIAKKPAIKKAAAQ